MKTCVIIAGGEFQAKFASSYINQKYAGRRPELLIAADRGIRGFLELGLLPDLILGDYDSVDQKDLQHILDAGKVENMPFSPEKNYSDSHLAVEQAVKRGASEICILGAVGNRLDHVLANIGLLKACADLGIQAELVDATNRMHIIQQQYVIQRENQHGVYVSILPYSDIVTGITMTGFQYPLENADISKDEYRDLSSNMGVSRGISNVIVGETAVIQIKSGDLLVIESRDRT